MPKLSDVFELFQTKKIIIENLRTLYLLGLHAFSTIFIYLAHSSLHRRQAHQIKLGEQ